MALDGQIKSIFVVENSVDKRALRGHLVCGKNPNIGMTRDDSSEDPFDLGLEREFKFQRGFKGKDSVVTIKVTESFNDSETGIGGQVWSSSVKLASFLVSNSSNADREKGFVALELGAGSTGLVGISALQSLVAKYVYFSDLQGSLECLHENVSRNIEDRKSWELVELDWCMPIKMEIFQNYVPNLLLAVSGLVVNRYLSRVDIAANLFIFSLS